MKNDILSQWLRGLGEFVFQLPPEFLAFLFRLALALALPTILCFVSYRQGSRSVFLQVSWCAVGLLVAGLLPLQHWTFDSKALRLIVLMTSALGIWFLPKLLAKFLVPELGRQQRIASSLYLIEGVLIVMQVFLKGGPG